MEKGGGKGGNKVGGNSRKKWTKDGGGGGGYRKMIIQIMATSAFRLWGTSGCAFVSAIPVVGIPLILLGSMWLGRKIIKCLLSLLPMNFASKLGLLDLTLVAPPSLTRHSALEEDIWQPPNR